MRKLLLAATALIALTTIVNANSLCLVADPTPTPLNVRKAPNGKILGALHNKTTVIVKEITLVAGKQWARMASAVGKDGWVLFDYLDCKTLAGVPGFDNKDK